MTATPIPAGVLLAGPPRPDGVPDRTETVAEHPVAAGERTGPLGLSEADTRKIAQQDNHWVDLAVGTGTLARTTWDAAQEACRAAVAEWDAEPQPAETLADIVADLRNGDELDRDYADRIEAASRPDPDTITVNRYDVRRAVDELDDATELPSPDLTRVILRLRAALAAAGLPQEDGS